MASKSLSTDCCIAGGGPAGLMLGYLLARAGVDVVVLEKHEDFLRDFRGDTIHPSTLENMYELGLLERFLQLPHQRAEAFFAQAGGQRVQMVDMSALPVQCPFVALMPQWDFLNFLADEGRRFRGFQLLMRTEANEVICKNGEAVGVRAMQNETPIEVSAKLVVAADGRTSVMRDRVGLKVRELAAAIDVLWFKVPRLASDGSDIGGQIEPGRIVVKLNRKIYWQCAFVIAKGGYESWKERGLETFHRAVSETTKIDLGRVREAIQSWDDVKLLNVSVNRLEQWHRPGFLAIGDAAHAMSPVGGVGVNLAIQDAVATANLLHTSLRDNDRVSEDELAQIARRRYWPTRLVQRMQVTAQKYLIEATLGADPDKTFVPMPVRIMQRLPFLSRLPARIIGLGVRMEHIAPELRSVDPDYLADQQSA